MLYKLYVSLGALNHHRIWEWGGRGLVFSFIRGAPQVSCHFWPLSWTVRLLMHLESVLGHGSATSGASGGQGRTKTKILAVQALVQMKGALRVYVMVVEANGNVGCTPLGHRIALGGPVYSACK